MKTKTRKWFDGCSKKNCHSVFPGMCMCSLSVCVNLTFVVWRPQCESRATADLWLTEKALFVSVWDRSATSALLAPPQALADLQIPEPGQALHCRCPSQTKSLYTKLSPLSHYRPPTHHHYRPSQTGLQQPATPWMLTLIPSIDRNKNFLTNAWVPIELCDLPRSSYGFIQGMTSCDLPCFSWK